jgi:hypothetical protein
MSFIYNTLHLFRAHPTATRSKPSRFLQNLVLACSPENQFTMILKDAAVKTRHELIFFDFL